METRQQLFNDLLLKVNDLRGAGPQGRKSLFLLGFL